MGTPGAPAVSGDAGRELETGREEGGSCEREGNWEGIYFISVLLNLLHPA